MVVHFEFRSVEFNCFTGYRVIYVTFKFKVGRGCRGFN